MSLNRNYSNLRIEQSTKEIIKGLEEITLEFKWGRIALPPSPLQIDVTHLPLKKISQNNLLLEASQNSWKKPVKEYKNMFEENEIKLLRLPAELWLHIYTFLDIQSLVMLTCACKTWGVIANDITIRARLYEAHESQKQTVLYNSLFSPNKLHINKWANLSLTEVITTNASPLPIQAQNTSLYNNSAPGKGFVMKE